MDERERESSRAYAQQNIVLDHNTIDKITNPRTAINELKLALKGKIVEVYVDENGKEEFIERKVSEPKCNDDGCQAIVSLFSTIVNPQGLGANLQRQEDYDRFISKEYERVAVVIMKNRIAWGIKSEDYPLIIALFISSVQLMLTHAINAGTRASITSTTQVKEIATVEPSRRGIFGIFKR